MPYLLFGLIAGPTADRGDRRKLIIGGNLVEGVLVGTIPLAAALGVLTIVQVYVVAVLSATAFVFSDAAVFGAVPALVGQERIAAANGVLAALASTADIAGPVLAGLLIAAVGAAPAVWVDSASFFVAAALIATIRSSFRTDDAHRDRPHVRDHLRRTVEFVRSRPVIGILFVAGFANSFAGGAVLGCSSPTELRCSVSPAAAAGSVCSSVPAASAACWPASASPACSGPIASPDELRSSVNVIGRTIAGVVNRSVPRSGRRRLDPRRDGGVRGRGLSDVGHGGGGPPRPAPS